MTLQDNIKLFKEDIFVRVGMNGPIINTIPECYHLLPRQQIFENISALILNSTTLPLKEKYSIDDISLKTYSSMFAWKLLCYINGIMSLDTLSDTKEILLPSRNYVLRLLSLIEDTVKEPPTQVIEVDLKPLGEPRFFTLGKIYDISWAKKFIEENYETIT